MDTIEQPDSDYSSSRVDEGQPTRLPDHPAVPASVPADEVIFERTGKQIEDLGRQAGFNLTPTANMLYTVRGNHAQLVNFARLVLATSAPTAAVDHRRDDDEAHRQFQRDRLEAARRHDAEEARPKLPTSAPPPVGSAATQKPNNPESAS